MANRNLITGAAIAYAPTYIDAGIEIAKGARNTSLGISPQTAAGLESMKNTDAKVKSYLDGLNTEMDLVEFSQPEQNSIKSYLFNQKQRYAQLATELAQTDATSDNYLNLKNEMDNIKQSFINLKVQTDKFKERKIQYLDDLENGRLSKGNKAEDYNIAGSVYGGGALLIDPDGGINVVVDGGKGIVRYSDVKDPILKDFGTADKILQQNNKLYSAGVKLDASKESLLRNQLKGLLSQSGALESIVEDGLINNTRLNIDINAYATREAAINDVAEMLLQGYRDSAAAGYNEKIIKANRNRPSTKQQQTQSATANMTARTGYSDNDRKIYFNKLKELGPGESFKIENISLSNDPQVRRGYGQVDYTITKSKDGKYVYEGIDNAGNLLSSGIFTEADLQKELLGTVTTSPTAEELIKKYSK